jgi:hypothetical protein
VVYKSIDFEAGGGGWKDYSEESICFLGGRNIMSNILVLHEILHETKRRREIGVVLKLAFEKTYDKVHWGYLVRCLEARGFNELWCEWISKVLCQGTVSVKLNDQTCRYFQSFKGVRQEDPLSPILFNFVVDNLTRMITRAQENNPVTDLISNLIPNGVAVLQYADDTIICLEHDLEKARNMKLLLYIFEQLSGLKINFDKNEILIIGGDNDLAMIYAKMFNCNVNLFPLRYLGVPIAAGRLHVADWVKLEEKSAKKLDV